MHSACGDKNHQFRYVSTFLCLLSIAMCPAFYISHLHALLWFLSLSLNRCCLLLIDTLAVWLGIVRFCSLSACLLLLCLFRFAYDLFTHVPFRLRNLMYSDLNIFMWTPVVMVNTKSCFASQLISATKLKFHFSGFCIVIFSDHISVVLNPIWWYCVSRDFWFPSWLPSFSCTFSHVPDIHVISMFSVRTFCFSSKYFLFWTWCFCDLLCGWRPLLPFTSSLFCGRCSHVTNLLWILLSASA